MFQEFEIMRNNRPIWQAILSDLQTNRELLSIANKEARREKKEQQERRRAVAQHSAVLTRRLAVAVCGLERLCGIAASPQFKKLLKVRGGHILFWGGEQTRSPGFDMNDVNWTWGASIKLTETGVLVTEYHLTNGRGRRDTLSFPHTVVDPSLRSLTLRHIATANPIDLERIVREDDVNNLYSMDVLFEILIECADREKFDLLLKNAIAGQTYTTP